MLKLLATKAVCIVLITVLIPCIMELYKIFDVTHRQNEKGWLALSVILLFVMLVASAIVLLFL